MPPLKNQVRRVAAWIYVVINPIISSLERELSLLESGNLTWRNTTHRCERIKSIQEYVDSSQWPNYQDFVAEHPKSVFISGFKHHDLDVEAVNNVASALFSRLLNLPDFQKALDHALVAYENSDASKSPQGSMPADLRQDAPNIVAELLINNTSQLPSHYMISRFWNSEGMNSLAAFKNMPPFEPLHQARRTLQENSAKLKLVLENFRLSLSRKYDVPAAPVPGLSFET
jgi:hypothetical protein